MAVLTLTSLPPEILLYMLSFLPIRDLLRFSQTSHTTHALATSSLRTLSLGVYPSRMAALISRLSELPNTYNAPIKSHFSVFPPPRSSTPPTSSPSASRKTAAAPTTGSWTSTGSLFSLSSDGDILQENPNAISVVVPDASKLNYETLCTFQSTLISSIFTRYQISLRHLDISIWRLSTSTAKALASITNLQTLSLQMEDPLVNQTTRQHVLLKRVEERIGWDILAEAEWKRNLVALNLEGAKVLDREHLEAVLQGMTGLEELWLRRSGGCSTKSIWNFLGGDWEGRHGLKVLGIIDSNVQLDQEATGCIAGLTGLKVSLLFFCNLVNLLTRAPSIFHFAVGQDTIPWSSKR